MRKWTICLLGIILSVALTAQIPVIGRDTLLEIGTWNTEWFGDIDNGPDNEVTQFDNIKTIIEQSKVDIWGLAEVSDVTTWNNLLSAVNTKYLGFISSYNQAQKTALLYDRNNFQIIQSLSGAVLTESQYNNDFAGRPPLLVTLKTKNRVITDTIYCFVIHMKAYGDKNSYERRLGASQALQTYLEAKYANKYWVVCGDWNDDLYTSTYNNSTSPYLNFSDTSKYVFISRELTDAGKRSYAFGNPGRMLDHILISAKMKQWYLSKTARVLDELPSSVSGFTSNTSDHYPVLGLFDNRIKPPSDTGSTGLFALNPEVLFTCYPNPLQDMLFIEAANDITQIEVYAANGAFVYQENEIQKKSLTINLSRLHKGIYLIRLQTKTGVGVKRILIK